MVLTHVPAHLNVISVTQSSSLYGLSVCLLLVREWWSLFTAGGGGGIPKIACTQNVPPLIIARHVSALPPNLCTEILPPPLATIHTFVC